LKGELNSAPAYPRDVKMRKDAKANLDLVGKPLSSGYDSRSNMRHERPSLALEKLRVFRTCQDLVFVTRHRSKFAAATGIFA